MIELVMTVCLMASPKPCEQKHQQFTEVTLMQCTMSAPSYIAKWVEEHPGSQIRGWRCTDPSREGRDA